VLGTALLYVTASLRCMRRDGPMVAVLLAAFASLALIGGIALEPRIFFEAIPLCLFPLYADGCTAASPRR
jgi:hypothetical protein